MVLQLNRTLHFDETVEAEFTAKLVSLSFKKATSRSSASRRVDWITERSRKTKLSSHICLTHFGLDRANKFPPINTTCIVRSYVVVLIKDLNFANEMHYKCIYCFVHTS